MTNLGTIYRFELKKILKRRLLWVTAAICMVCILISTTASLYGTYYVAGEPIESNYESFKKDQSYRKSLSGRLIDDSLLQETVDAYSHVPADVEKYTVTEEYEVYARPYSDIFNMIRTWMGMNLKTVQQWQVDEEALYTARMNSIEKNWENSFLTEAEKEFWSEKESLIETPLVYMYHDGYENMFKSFLTVGMVMLMFVAICLSNLFTDEHVRRTDQLVLSSACGRNTVYWAKILAGVTVAVGAAVMMSILTIGLCMGIYGTEGFTMPLQSCLSSYSYPMTIGQACIIVFGILIVTSVIAAVFVMVVSELTRSGVGVLAISTGLIILSNMVSVPAQYRVLGQLWDWMPMSYLSTWNVFDCRTLIIFGQSFTSWQIVPVIYLLCSAALAAVGKVVYERWEVG